MVSTGGFTRGGGSIMDTFFGSFFSLFSEIETFFSFFSLFSDIDAFLSFFADVDIFFSDLADMWLRF